MSYKLYTDKQEVFECDVSVKNANLKNSVARIVVESDEMNLIFKGKIDNGKCIVPIKKLKGILNESTKGIIHLEIIVEDVYFKPWESDFVVEEHTSIKVDVKEQKESYNKPIVEVKVKQPIVEVKTKQLKKETVSIPATEIVSICNRFDINSKNYKTSKKDDFKELIKEYFKANKPFKTKMIPILNEVVTYLR
jgi:hypothetical protein